MFGHRKNYMLIQPYRYKAAGIFIFSMLVMSNILDFGISYSVFKYERYYFIEKEANRWFINALVGSSSDMLGFILFDVILTSVLVFCFYCVYHSYRKYFNKQSDSYKKFKEAQFFAAELWFFYIIIACLTSGHIIGGLSWL